MAAAKALGVQTIYMTDKINERLTAAAANGAAWTGNPDRADIVAALTDKAPGGIDIIFECAGKQETIDEAIEFLRPGGKLMLIGIPEFERTSFVIDKMRRKEITVVNVRRQNRCTQIAVDWTGDRTVNVDFMVTHRFRFEETAAAFDLVAGYRDGVIKAMIEL
jgi:threonine dehydrogenase-like Zn-dependent dehydrogenase